MLLRPVRYLLGELIYVYILKAVEKNYNPEEKTKVGKDKWRRRTVKRIQGEYSISNPLNCKNNRGKIF